VRPPAGRLVRAGVVAAALVVALNLAVLALGAAGANQGPPSSSYSTAPAGAAAYAELLARLGHPVARLRDAPEAADLSSTDVVVVLDPPGLSAPAARRLRRFVEGGGTLVAGGSSPHPWLVELLERPPLWSPAGLRSATVSAPLPEVDGARTVAASGRGSWVGPGDGIAAVGAPERSLVVAATAGAGRMALLADTSMLHNRHLDDAGNAAVAAALAGAPHERVGFLESIHGYGPRRGLAALPARWRWILGGLVLAALVGMASRARRLGPPEAAEDVPGPRRGDHVTALADLLARTGRPEEALAPLRAAARDEVLRAAGLPLDASAGALVAAALARGLPPGEARALVAPVASDDAVLALGRAAARLSGAPGATR
jgi:hypothetical protein